MTCWVILYWRTYDPGLVLTGTVLAHDVAHALAKARAAFEIPFEQITGVLRA